MSKEVKRFDPYGYDGLSALMHEDVLGDYVQHEDYDALLAERDALLEALKKIDEADWRCAAYATDNEVSMAKGTLIRQMKRIARAAMQGDQQ